MFTKSVSGIVFVIPEDIRRAATERRAAKVYYVTISRLLWSVGGLTAYRRHNLETGVITFSLRFNRKSIATFVIGQESLE